jgi:hypothetical protein
MSHVRRRIFRRKLDDLLARADDEAFFIMCWATLAIQSGRAGNARDLLSVPPEAVTDDISSPFKVHPWNVETLLNEVLTTPKLKVVPGRSNRILNCGTFSATGAVVNALLGLENAEDGIVLKRVDVLREMHRLTQRQFDWQRGFVSHSQLYRSGFLYGGELTRAFFARNNGFTIDDFSLACFALRVIFLERPSLTINGGLDPIGLSEATLRSVVGLISLPHAAARVTARELRGGGGHTAYKRSLFRTYPCVRFGAGRTVAPLPELIALRATSGLFYDLAGGGGDVKNEISGRFEVYCRELLGNMLTGLRVRGSYKYPIRKGQIVDTPDVLLYEGEGLSVVFECKATRMSYQARFSENPMADDRRGYAEMARGIFQIWRFVSHRRRGLLSEERFRANVTGVVLTLDTWLSMANTMLDDVFGFASEIADKRDPEILEEDRIPVIFCSIEDLEHTLAVSTPASFLGTIGAATEERFKGWMISSVHREFAPDLRVNNDFPFAEKVAEVLPWWTRFRTSSSA